MLSLCSSISFKVANVELWCRWEISKLEVEICVDLPTKEVVESQPLRSRREYSKVNCLARWSKPQLIKFLK